MNEETWKPVVGYTGLYEVSSDGRVRSLVYWGRRVVRELKPTISFAGYPTVGLRKNHKNSVKYVHTLILEAFVGPRPGPSNSIQARHLDGNRRNSVLTNLQWGTRKQNCADRLLHGTDARGVNCPTAKLTRRQVISMRNQYARGGISYAKLGELYGVAVSAAWSVVKRKTYYNI